MSSRRNFLKSGLLPLSLGALVPSLVQANPIPSQSQSLLSLLLKSMNRNTIWKEVASIPFTFPTHHCQGMVKIGEDYWVSSVEVLPEFAGDLSHGKGYLFQVSATGQLLNSLELGEGSLYHPSGIDFDGSHLWIALAAYKPNSQSIIYKIDPFQRTVKEVFRWEDHLGAIALNPDTQILHGASWGSRTLYQWDSKAVAKKQGSPNPFPTPANPIPPATSTTKTTNTWVAARCFIQGWQPTKNRESLPFPWADWKSGMSSKARSSTSYQYPSGHRKQAES